MRPLSAKQAVFIIGIGIGAIAGGIRSVVKRREVADDMLAHGQLARVGHAASSCLVV
jgi:hypothetical protein